MTNKIIADLLRGPTEECTSEWLTIWLHELKDDHSEDEDQEKIVKINRFIEEIKTADNDALYKLNYADNDDNLREHLYKIINDRTFGNHILYYKTLNEYLHDIVRQMEKYTIVL